MIDDICKKLDQHTEMVKQTFSGMIEAQLGWRPNPDKWNIGTCLDHLITTNSTYFSDFHAIGAGTYKMAFWTRISPFSAFLGRWLVANMGKDVKKPYRSPKAFLPDVEKVNPNIVQDFIAHQEKLKEHLRGMNGKELEKIRMPSPANNTLTYSVEHAVLLMEAHEARHLKQAADLMQLDGFPTGN